MARSAHNITPDSKYGKGLQQYFCDDGSTIFHEYEDGAVVLAKKLLDTIKEKK